MEPKSTVLVFVCFAVALLVIFAPGLWADLRAAVAAIRAGAKPERREPRGGYAAIFDEDAPAGQTTLRINLPPDNWRKFQSDKPVRESPGHRNFGIPARSDTSDWPVLDGSHPGLTGGVGRHILGDH